MKVLVAGATGALGRQLLPRLVARGHEVVGTTRSEAKQELVRELGGTPAVMDALDPDEVARVVEQAAPEVIVHELTALAGARLRNWDRGFAMTNRLRTEGTHHLLTAGKAVGARKFLAQSYAGWPFARTGGRIKTEDDPLDPSPPADARETLAAIRELEATVTGAEPIEGMVLRYGTFYGPGTSFAPGGEVFELIRRRRFPVVGDGQGRWSFIHVEDAADATVAAIEHGRRGIYHIVDDTPAPVAEWLPTMARRIGARSPLRVPKWLGRLLAGDQAVVTMTESRGASNAKAKWELGWQPAHPTWRESLG